MKNKLTWISVIGLVAWFNFIILPMRQDYATKIETQAVEIDTLTGVLYQQGQNLKPMFYLMEEGVDLLKIAPKATRSVWQAHDRVTGELLWERKASNRQMFVLSTKYLLEVEDKYRQNRVISRIDLRTGHVIWQKKLLSEWENIDVDLGNRSILLEYNEYDRAKGEWMSDSLAYQIIQASNGEIDFFIETTLGQTPLSELARTVDFDIIRRLKISWENMDYYPTKNIFFSKTHLTFYQGKWSREKVRVKEVEDYWALHHYGTPYLKQGELLLLPKSKSNFIPRFLEYDIMQKVEVWDQHLVKVIDKGYNYYALNDGGVSLENREWRKSNLFSNESWLTTKAGKAEWMIEQSKTHLYLNNILNLEQKKIQMNHIGAKRELKKEGDWLYIYEIPLIEEDNNKSSGVIYKYKLPINFESQ